MRRGKVENRRGGGRGTWGWYKKIKTNIFRVTDRFERMKKKQKGAVNLVS